MELQQERGIGDNQPPEDANPIADRLEQAHMDLVRRRDELEAALERVPECNSDEAEKKIGDYIKELTKCMKKAEAIRVDEKEPYLENGRKVDGWFKQGIIEPLNKIKKQVNASLTIYQREKEAAERKVLVEKAEADRQAAIEAEEAAQRAADDMSGEADLSKAVDREAAAEKAADEAAEAEKAAGKSAADLSRTRSEKGGSVSSLRVTWEFEGIDRDTLDLEALREHLPMDGLEKAVRAYVKAGGRELKGVARIYEDKQAVVR